MLATLRGAFTLALIVLNTVLWGVPLLCLAAVKLLVPARAARESLGRGLIALAENWISSNNLILRFTRALRLELRGETRLGQGRALLVEA